MAHTIDTGTRTEAIREARHAVQLLHDAWARANRHAAEFRSYGYYERANAAIYAAEAERLKAASECAATTLAALVAA